MTRRAIAIAVWVLAGLGVILAPAESGAGDGLAPDGDLPRAKQSPSGIDERLGAQLPLDLVLRDEEEKPTTLRECIAGKPTILLPMYYRCPMLCNLMLKNLVDALRAMPLDFSAGGKFNVVAVSFDPKEHCDLASEKKKVVLQEYGRVGAENGWRFLTGSKEAIAELMATIGYRFEFDKSFKEYNHPSGIIIVSPEGKLTRYFYGISYNDEYRVPGGTTTLRLSLIEAADGKGGSMLDRLILNCYRFDHLKGYSLDILRAVQIGGIVTLLAVCLYVFVALFRERVWGEGPQLIRLGEKDNPAAPGQTNDGLPSGGNV